MELSKIILLHNDDFETSLEDTYGVVYMLPGLNKKYPWWIRKFSYDGKFPLPDFEVPQTKISCTIGVPLSGTAHKYRIAIFGQRWIEDLNMGLVSLLPSVKEVNVQGDDYIKNIDIMRVLQHV